MQRIIAGCLALALYATTVNADGESASTALSASPASGYQSGPGLWKVSRPDGHVLWLLGTVNPKPKGFKWRSQAVTRAIADSQLVLRQSNEMPAGIEVELYTLDPLQHMRAALHEKQLEHEDEGTPLKDVLPPALYARFSIQKERYFPHKHSLEKQRPRVAANRLYRQAIDDAGLSTRAAIHEEVERIADRYDVEIEDVTLQIQVNLKTAMEIDTERSKQSAATEIPCLQVTIEQLETQLPVMTARANAWAAGNVEELRRLPLLTRDACNYAPWSAPRWKDLPQRLSKHWLDTVEAALNKNRSTFVMIDMSELLKPNGLLAALQSKGYQVVAP